jgi:flagellar hook-length control protein FliK
MIELSTQIPQTTIPVSGPAAPGGAAGGFVQLLAAFLDAGAAAAPDAPADAGLPGDRQSLAGDGKTVPATLADDGKPIDPALIWLPIALPIPAPVAPPIMLPPAGAPPAAAIADPATLAITGAFVMGDGAADPKTDGPVKEMSIPGGDLAAKKDAAAADPLSKTVGAAPTPAVSTAQPAGQTFAAAIAAVLANHDRPARDDDRGDSRGTAALTATAQAEAAARPIVQAIADAKHPALDLRDDRGLHGMIDRIEMLRDEANANDTRIRLVPDALGGVDVSLRKDGDTLHVHFTADTQATRTLLNDAQPRLAELADARGVKLGQTSVDAGTGGNANHTHHQPRTAARRAAAPASAADDFSTDQRLA